GKSDLLFRAEPELSLMKIMSVVGARPNFMKVAPIIAAIRRHNAQPHPGPVEIEHVLVHTGQHYDEAMSGSFFRDLGLPAPDVHLGVGSGSHAAQTAEIMKRFEAVLSQSRPDALLVAGDVNSTLACALVAAKADFDSEGLRPLIAHVEAGLRSFDRSMPEEINRVLTDHLSDLLFVTEPSGVQNLEQEGIPSEKVFFVGNTMIDSLLACKERSERSAILDHLGLCNGRNGSGPLDAVIPYALLTLHRPANVDRRQALVDILEGLEELVKEMPVVFPAHPRTMNRIREFGLDPYFDWSGALHTDIPPGAGTRHAAILLTQPLGYLDFLCLMSHATLVVTDSGGIQEETTCLGVPCVTVRENTERPVTTAEGTNILAGVKPRGILASIASQLRVQRKGSIPKKWDGRAAERIVSILASNPGKAKSMSNDLVCSIADVAAIGSRDASQ
ncbi:MAG: non-hydrolyzing UDP-N-acetylglucosamine 2-epimerase, partial [Terriglobia bacterium]